MAKEEDGTRFERRPGTDPFGGSGWRLVNTQDDPGSLEPNELLWAENVRKRGKIIITRPGMTQKIALGTYSARSGGVGSVMGMWDKHGHADTKTKLWLSALGCLGFGSTGYQTWNYDPTQSPGLQLYVDNLATSDRFSPVARYGDRLFIGDGALFREVVLIEPPFGVDVGTMLGQNRNPLNEVNNFSGYTINCMLENNGLLFIGLNNTATPTNSKIVSWNGSKFVDEITGVRPPQAMGKWRDKLVVGFDSTAAHIRVRENSSSQPGTWNTVSLGGFRCSINQNSICEVGALTFIAGGAQSIYQFDGTTLSLARTVGAADGGTDGVTALCLHDGLLHYAWGAAATFNARIGRRDPDATANTWVDTHLDITAQVAGFLGPTSLASYRRRLFVGGRGGDEFWFVATAANDVQGTVETLSTGYSASSSYRPRQLLVFP